MMPMRLRLAAARAMLIAAVASAPAMLAVTADGGPLEPFGKIFKEPADTLKGLVQPKGRHAPPPTQAVPPPEPEAAPPAEAAAAPAATPDPPETVSAPAASSVPTPRLRPDADSTVVAEAPPPAADAEEERLPLDVSQHEDAIEAMIAARSLGAVHEAANPDPAQTSEPEPPLLSYAPGDDIPVTPNLRPKTAAITPDLQEERSSAILGVLRQGGSCSKTLSTLGVTAVSVSPIRKGSCGVAAPVEVAALGGGAVKLSAKATVNCDVASTLAAFMRDVVDPLARQKLGANVTEIRVAASYACRGRNNVAGAKLSEHAKGNAIDISAFKVKGEWIVVGGKNGLAQNAFLREVRKAACGPFTTVLGPGSDRYHSDHFHFDLAQRGKSGRGLYCH